MNVCACKVLGEMRNSTELISNDSIIPTRREEAPLSSGDGGSYLSSVVPADPGLVMQACRAEARLAGVTRVSMGWELQTT